MLVILATGQESTKKEGGKQGTAIPLVATDNTGWTAQLGVGVILRGHRDYKGIDIGELPSISVQVWGLVGPHNLIQSWRGMKILEQIQAIDHGTLCHCWYAGGRTINNESDIADVVAQLGQSTLDKLREELLLTGPSPFELDQMLDIAKEWGIDINGQELEGEVARKTIMDTEAVRSAIQSWHEYLSQIEEEKKVEEPTDEQLVIEQAKGDVEKGFWKRLLSIVK